MLSESYKLSSPKCSFCWIQAVEESTTFFNDAHAHVHNYWTICLCKSTTGATSHLRRFLYSKYSCTSQIQQRTECSLHREQKCFLAYLVLLHCYTSKVLVYQGTRMFIAIFTCAFLSLNPPSFTKETNRMTLLF